MGREAAKKSATFMFRYLNLNISPSQPFLGGVCLKAQVTRTYSPKKSCPSIELMAFSASFKVSYSRRA